MVVHQHIEAVTHSLVTHPLGLAGALVQDLASFGPFVAVLASLGLAWAGWTREDRRKRRDQAGFVLAVELTFQKAAHHLSSLGETARLSYMEVVWEMYKETSCPAMLGEFATVGLRGWPDALLYLRAMEASAAIGAIERAMELTTLENPLVPQVGIQAKQRRIREAHAVFEKSYKDVAERIAEIRPGGIYSVVAPASNLQGWNIDRILKIIKI